MYASLISAGASQLYDLYKNVTGGGSSANTSFDPSSSTPSVGATDAVSSTGTSGSKFSDALQKLFTDLQSNSSNSSGSATASTDPTSTIASDLKSVFGSAQGAHGHHHGPPPAQLPGDNNQSVDGASSIGDTGTRNTGSFQNVASSLLAYARNQSLTSSASATSLTA